VPDSPLTFERFQEIQNEWALENFGEEEAWKSLIGLQEELGELSRAHLKSEQGIRGTAEKWEREGRKEVGDIITFLSQYCSRRGWKLHECVEESWKITSDRNWRDFPESGKPDPLISPKVTVRFMKVKEKSMQNVIDIDKKKIDLKTPSQPVDMLPEEDADPPLDEKKVLKFTKTWQGKNLSSPEPFKPPPKPVQSRRSRLSPLQVALNILGMTQRGNRFVKKAEANDSSDSSEDEK
jgi:NTP pyrophosphatase (non-canonical NTP hydrolase)